MKQLAKRLGWIFFWTIWCFILFFWIIWQKESYFCSNRVLEDLPHSTVVSTNFFSNAVTKQTTEKQREISKDWILEIPKLELKQKIEEGTSQAVLKRAIGHFSETPSWEGNVGLAAHNRNGGEAGFFSDIKTLKSGDEIKYQKDGKTRTYRVIQNLVISETDWSYLEPTQKNYLTLITCEEGKYEYRRCIQAIETEE